MQSLAPHLDTKTKIVSTVQQEVKLQLDILLTNVSVTLNYQPSDHPFI